MFKKDTGIHVFRMICSAISLFLIEFDTWNSCLRICFLSMKLKPICTRSNILHKCNQFLWLGNVLCSIGLSSRTSQYNYPHVCLFRGRLGSNCKATTTSSIILAFWIKRCSWVSAWHQREDLAKWSCFVWSKLRFLEIKGDNSCCFYISKYLQHPFRRMQFQKIHLSPRKLCWMLWKDE